MTLAAVVACLAIAQLAGCGAEAPTQDTVEPLTDVAPRPEIYAGFALAADLGIYTDGQREMIALLIEASEIIDDLFWQQTWGPNPSQWLASIDDDDARLFAAQNYGPWDRLDRQRPFIEGAGAKPLGANLYPADMTREEFEFAYLPGKADRYSLVRRNARGELILVPYHVAYAQELKALAQLLRSAADLAESADFATYLKLRASALLSDNYQLSDLFWMDVKDNEIDIIIGPIETGEDRLFGYRGVYESVLVLKDLDWSARLAILADMLPELQAELPVPAEYKQQFPGSDADLNAYDVIYYAGSGNVGVKAMELSLPNDDQVQLQKGARRLLLRNAMRAKFETILEPVADVLIDGTQRQHVNFDAFFSIKMLHEVAHGLGIQDTINGKGTVRDALRDMASTVEEGKADALGLYMIRVLSEAGELDELDRQDCYVTALAAALHAIRDGAGGAQGMANVVRFNDFVDSGAFVRDPDSGRYRVDFERIEAAIEGLARRLLMLQGDGAYEEAVRLTSVRGVVSAQLRADLERVAEKNIPIDITFNQGLAYLGLE